MLRAGRTLSRRLTSNLQGFHVVNQFEVDDLKLKVTERVHQQSDAKWTHIDKHGETEKVFNICFRTVPFTDNGVAHILGIIKTSLPEHAMINLPRASCSVRIKELSRP